MPDIEMCHPRPAGLDCGSPRYHSLKSRLSSHFSASIYLGVGPAHIAVSFYFPRNPMPTETTKWFRESKAIVAAS